MVGLNNRIKCKQRCLIK